MSTRQGYYNRDIGKWVDSTGLSQYTDASKPYITRREQLTFELNILKTNADGSSAQFDGWATGGPYSYRFFIDNDYVNYMTGDLETAITAGAITEIKIENLVTTSGTPLSTGRIVLTNTSGESETIAYTAYSLAAGVYTFTVSATAAYSYSAGDPSKVVEPSLVEVETDDIDQINKDTGILIVSMDANNEAFTNAADAAAAAEIPSCLFELQVLDGTGSIVDTIGGEFRCLNLLVDDFAGPPTGPTSNYYTKAESLAIFDARYQQSKVTVNQVAHGFAINDAVYNNAGTWTKAQADDPGTLGVAVVSEVEDVDNFSAKTSGDFTSNVHGYTVGAYLYVSAITAGLLVETAPTGLTEYSNPLIYVLDANTLVAFPWRPEQALVRTLDTAQSATSATTYNVLDTDEMVLADATAAAITVNLPTPSATYDGFTVTVKNTGDGSFAVTAKSSTGDIDGVTGTTGIAISATMDKDTFVCDGTDWWIK